MKHAILLLLGYRVPESWGLMGLELDKYNKGNFAGILAWKVI